jgi:hypothetical protein
MFGHLINLLARAFMAIPQTLGSNWLGLIFTIVVILIGETIGLWLFGWNSMIQNWKKG